MCLNNDQRLEFGLNVCKEFAMLVNGRESSINEKYNGNLLFFLPGAEEINGIHLMLSQFLDE